MREKRKLRVVVESDSFADVLKRVSARARESETVTEESGDEAVTVMLERAKEHAARGGKRGSYEGERLKSFVLLMVEPTMGYVEGNLEIVPLGISLLYEHGFSFEKILDFVLRSPNPQK